MKLKPEAIENFSNVKINLFSQVKPLKKDKYEVLDLPVSGDAPKNFIKVYEYNKSKRWGKKKHWPAHIAKVGQKWYPIESITEQFMTLIGKALGLNIADSQLRMAGPQLRFLSRFFINTKKGESLVHGAEIFAGYIEERDWVEQIEKEGESRKYFTFQFAEKAIKARFPEQANEIENQFVRMLVFDAIVGNNDRHFYNWGIIININKNKRPIFAPIFDTARGLFWNDSEEKIVNYFKNSPGIDVRINKYIHNSKPKTGWEGLKEINHFTLIQRIYLEDDRYKQVIKEILSEEKYLNISNLFEGDLVKLFSGNRKKLIKLCIEKRWNTLLSIINKEIC